MISSSVTGIANHRGIRTRQDRENHDQNAADNKSACHRHNKGSLMSFFMLFSICASYCTLSFPFLDFDKFYVSLADLGEFGT